MNVGRRLLFLTVVVILSHAALARPALGFGTPNPERLLAQASTTQDAPGQADKPEDRARLAPEDRADAHPLSLASVDIEPLLILLLGSVLFSIATGMRLRLARRTSARAQAGVPQGLSGTPTTNPANPVKR